MNNYKVKWYSPVTGCEGIVETTKHGVTLEKAEAVAKDSNRDFKPLQYTVITEEVK